MLSIVRLCGNHQEQQRSSNRKSDRNRGELGDHLLR